VSNLVTDFVCSFPANSFVTVIQTVDESVHDFRVAAAVVVPAKFVESTTTI
jgi:hypothetical protein